MQMYQVITRALEDRILAGLLKEGAVVPSTHKLAEEYNVNPATAARGAHELTERGFFEKQRGIGLFVAEGTREKLTEERRVLFRASLKEIAEEAELLGFSKQQLIAMIM